MPTPVSRVHVRVLQSSLARPPRDVRAGVSDQGARVWCTFRCPGSARIGFDVLHGRSPCDARFARHRVNVRSRAHLAGAHGCAHWGSDRFLPSPCGGGGCGRPPVHPAACNSVPLARSPRGARASGSILLAMLFAVARSITSRCSSLRFASRTSRRQLAFGDSITLPCSNRPPALRSPRWQPAFDVRPRFRWRASRACDRLAMFGPLSRPRWPCGSETAVAFRSSRGARAALASSAALRLSRPRSRSVHLGVLGLRASSAALRLPRPRSRSAHLVAIAPCVRFLVRLAASEPAFTALSPPGIQPVSDARFTLP